MRVDSPSSSASGPNQNPSSSLDTKARTKQSVREAMLEARASYAAQAKEDATNKIKSGILGCRMIPSDAVVAGYLPMSGEADPRPAMIALAARGRILALPRVEKENAPLIFRKWGKGILLEKDLCGIPGPSSASEKVRPRVILVPVVAFDRFGSRLGMGRGYYDRTLAKLRDEGPVTAIGVAYAVQQIADLPKEKYDEKLDALVTEKGIWLFNRPEKNSTP